ncbi:hypothetical protein STEG23_027844 [Scotinomys teguina]
MSTKETWMMEHVELIPELTMLPYPLSWTTKAKAEWKSRSSFMYILWLPVLCYYGIPECAVKSLFSNEKQKGVDPDKKGGGMGLGADLQMKKKQDSDEFCDLTWVHGQDEVQKQQMNKKLLVGCSPLKPEVNFVRHVIFFVV